MELSYKKTDDDFMQILEMLLGFMKNDIKIRMTFPILKMKLSIELEASVKGTSAFPFLRHFLAYIYF
jgi:hypothetical protein